MEVDRDNAYRSVLLCRLAGLSLTETLRVVFILDALYGNSWSLIPYSTIKKWYHGLYRHKLTRLNTLDRSLFYHGAYKLAMEIRKEHPEWGYKRVATELNKRLPIRVPPSTIYYWITEKSKPNSTPVRVVPELGYLAGVLVGDYGRTRGGLGVKDRRFIEYYVKAYEKVTGVRLEIHERNDEEYGGTIYYTEENGGFMRVLWRTGLWKTIALIYPIEFLQGLYDSEGSIAPGIIKLTTGDQEVMIMARHLLHKLSFQTKTYEQDSMTRILGEREVHFGKAYKIHIRRARKMMPRFAQLIGFRESKRKTKLEKILQSYPHKN